MNTKSSHLYRPVLPRYPSPPPFTSPLRLPLVKADRTRIVIGITREKRFYSSDYRPDIRQSKMTVQRYKRTVHREKRIRIIHRIQLGIRFKIVFVFTSMYT